MATRQSPVPVATLMAALEYIRMGKSYREAADHFKIPKSTLQYGMHQPIRKVPGRKLALTAHEEQLIVDLLIRFANRGLPLTQNHLCEAISVVISRMVPARRLLLPFNRNRPSKRFLIRFRKRHAAVLRFARPVTQEAVRFRQCNGDVFTSHFATLQKLIVENDLSAKQIFNLDETGVTPEKEIGARCSSRRIMPRRGAQNLRRPDFTGVARMSFMPVVSAAGDCDPPLFVVKGHSIPYRTVRTPAGAVRHETPLCNLPRSSVMGTRDDRGGVDRFNFLSWAEDVVEYVSDLTKTGKKMLLVYDGYRSHLSLEATELFANSGIIAYALPSHTSGKTQPLDSIVFGAFKHALNEAAQTCVLAVPDRSFDMFDFASLLNDAYYKSFTAADIKAGFRRTGIWPLNPSRLLGNPLPATGQAEGPLLTVEELEKCLQSKIQTAKDIVLGKDATIEKSGYLYARGERQRRSEPTFHAARSGWKGSGSRKHRVTWREMRFH